MGTFFRNIANISKLRQFKQCKSAKNVTLNFLRQNSNKTSSIFSTSIPEFENKPGINSYSDLYQFSLSNPDEFWGTLARSRLRWYSDFDRVQDCYLKEGNIAWFLNGKLNVSDNCVDRHYEKNPNKIALIWEKDEPNQEQYITYRELYEMVNQLANTLKSNGVRKGDRVVLYMPVSPHAVAAMLACTRIGALHSVVFAGFSAEALASRIQDSFADTVITADQGFRGGKVIELKKTVDAAVAKCPGVKRVFVYQRTGAKVSQTDLDIPLEEEMSKQSTECPAEIMDSEDFLFFLYTSGSTGTPKGVAHTQAGYLLYAAITTKFVFDYNEGDIFGCMADIGWITGHTYTVYGPLSNGATSVLFESTPTYPDPGRYWETVERLKINQFYCAPTALRLLIKYGDSYVTKYDRSSLKALGCVGEPLNHEAFDWYRDVIGDNRSPVIDTWWQTETGGHCITPRPSAPGAVIKAGMPMRPFFGIEPVLLNKDEKTGKMTEIEEPMVDGALCIKKPWPGMARTILGDHQRFLDTYLRPYPGYYFSGDGAHTDEDGDYRIIGRMDDVINTSGHRLGTAEIEDVMDLHPAVAETAVVGYPHGVKGEGIYAYITLKEGVSETEEDIIVDLKKMVREQIAAYAVPEMMQVSSGLPKTRSGKIMRRILRKVAANKPDELGDISTLADPSVVEGIVENHLKLVAEELNKAAKESD